MQESTALEHCPKLQTDSRFSHKKLFLKTTRIAITIAIRKGNHIPS